MNKRYFLSILCSMVVVVLANTMSSCTQDTGTLGIPCVNETLQTSVCNYNVMSKSMKIENIKANSSSSYLGCIYDPETKGKITASMITQFALMEEMKYFPQKDQILSRDAQGNPCCDTVFLQFNFDTYYGDVNEPMKLAIYPLDKNNPLREDCTYYINTNLRDFIDPNHKDKPIATKVFTAWDRIHGSDPSNTSSGNYPSIRVPLPLKIGNEIMNKYWKYLEDNQGLSPNNHVNRDFDDSYHFIRNVMPGFYAEVTNGEGVMVRVFVDALYLIYKARVDVNGSMEEIPSYTTFAGTPEVVQSCQFTESDVNSLVNNESCTWLKTPTGICTELTLPIDDIYSDEHSNDSLSKVELTLNRFVKEQTGNQFSIPYTLLLVRKAELAGFFENNRTPDSKNSYLASYQSTYNTYTFANISQMASYMHHYRENGVKNYIKDVLKIENPTDEQYALAREAWAELEENKDWNKCCLLPVSISTNTSTGAVTSVAHELSLTSARLVRGTCLGRVTDSQKSPINVKVYYTKVVN